MTNKALGQWAKTMLLALVCFISIVSHAQVTISPSVARYLTSSSIPPGTLQATGVPSIPGATIRGYRFYIHNGNAVMPNIINDMPVTANIIMRIYGWSLYDTSITGVINQAASFSLDTVSLGGFVLYDDGVNGTRAESFTTSALMVKIGAGFFNFGTINGAGKTICANASVGSISQTTAPTSTTTPTYQWYYQNGDNPPTWGLPALTTGWTLISGATSATYNPGTSVSVNRAFARTTTLTDPTFGWTVTGWSTNVFQVTINTPPTFTAGAITARRDSFCYVSNAPLVAEQTHGSITNGGPYVLQYQWYQRTGLYASAPTGTTVPSGWTAIAGATDSTFDPPSCNYASLSYARRVRTNHPCSGWLWSTNTAQTIIKTNCVTWGAIDRTSQTVCDMGDPYSFQVTFNSTNFRADSATWQWYYKDGLQSAPEPDDAIGSWQWITYYPQRTNSYDPPAGAYTSRTYACRVTLINPVGYAPGRYTKWARCAAQVNKLNPVSYGTLSGNLFSCWGTAPSGIALSTSPSGGAGQFTYQWYYINGFYGPLQGSTIGWTAIAGANAPALTNAPILTDNATFACLVTPTGTPGCGPAQWANGQVYVNMTGRPTDFGSLGWTTQNVSATGDPTAFSFVRMPVGSAGPFSFQWYVKAGYAAAPGFNDPVGTWQAINGATNAVYDPPRYPNQTLTYAVRVTLGGTPNCGTRWAEGSRTVILNNAWSGGGLSSNGGNYGIDGWLRKVQVAPNPFVNTVNLTIDAQQSSPVNFVVTDLTGRRVHSQQLQLQEGVNQFKIDQLDGLGAGIYLMHFEGAGGKLTHRMVKE